MKLHLLFTVSLTLPPFLLPVLTWWYLSLLQRSLCGREFLRHYLIYLALTAPRRMFSFRVWKR